MDVQAIYAAPFLNDRSSSPKDGMEKSYNEIYNVLDKLNIREYKNVFKGSEHFLKDKKSPCISQAAKDIVRRAMNNKDGVIYILATGALTDIASAILLEPKIIEKIVVVWLGGNAHYWPHTREFNLYQDLAASKLIFDCSVPLIHIPCMGVTTHLHTNIPELEYYLKGKSAMGDYLIEIVKGYTDNPFAWSKVVWDIAVVAWAINPEWVPTNIVNAPILTDQFTWSFDSQRHFMRVATYVERDKIFGDLFKKLV